MIRRGILLAFFELSCSLSAQTGTLSLTDFYTMIMAGHPVMKQAALLPEIARMELRTVRGQFDPTLQLLFDTKEVKEKEYYSYRDVVLKVPTWVGPDIKAGWEQNSGIYLDGYDLTPGDGYLFAGISTSISQGLLVDLRRNTLMQAQLLLPMADAERIKVMNKLLLNAAKDYMAWYEAWAKYQIAKTGMDLADERLRWIRERVRLGDLATVDTVEASVEVQRREISLQESRMEYMNSTLMLSTYCWSPDGQPMELTPGLMPVLPAEIESIVPESPESDALFAIENHPEIRKITLKGEQLRLERTYLLGTLLPDLRMEYTPLWDMDKWTGDFSFFSKYQVGYKFGMSLYVPLFLRKERGKLMMVTQKMQQNNLELSLARVDIRNQVLASWNAMDTYRSVVRTQRKTVQLLQTLLNAENVNFKIGEGTLFLLIQRERALLDAQVKLAETEVKFIKAYYTYVWSTGVPMQP